VFDISSAGIPQRGTERFQTRVLCVFHVEARTMTVGFFAKQLRCSTIGALLLMAGAPSRALAQSDHMHGTTSQPQPLTPDQKAKAGALITVVREATERFQNPVVAEGEGYVLQFGCVSGS